MLAAAFLATMLVGICPAAVPAHMGEPGDSRLFIGPTARMLPPGQGYIAFDGIFLATVQVGVTRHFSMGAGTPLFWLGGASQPFWVTPKVRLYSGERTSVAAGLMNMFVPGSGQVGLAYTVSTVGTPVKSVTIGGAVLYARDVVDSGVSVGAPVVLVGGDRRLGTRRSFVTENYVGAHGGFASAGLRRHLERWQLSLGGMLSCGSEYAFPGIWFSFARKFGGSR